MKKEFNEIYSVLTESWYEGMENMKPNERLQNAVNQLNYVNNLMREIGEAEFLNSPWVRFALAEASVKELNNIYKSTIEKLQEAPDAKELINRLEDEYLHNLAILKTYNR